MTQADLAHGMHDQLGPHGDRAVRDGAAVAIEQDVARARFRAEAADAMAVGGDAGEEELVLLVKEPLRVIRRELDAFDEAKRFVHRDE
jgi:hypothetical protein